MNKVFCYNRCHSFVETGRTFLPVITIEAARKYNNNKNMFCYNRGYCFIESGRTFLPVTFF